MSKYLEAAAALVKKGSDENEAKDDTSWRENRRVEYAKLYALLAAVDKGLMPEAVAEEIYGQLRSQR
jgi:hypothetical protein